jgi:hypothetical protein
LASSSATHLLLQFIAATKRFEQIYGELRAPDRASRREDHPDWPRR